MTKKWTNPEIFKKVCEHLISQGKPAVSDDAGGCSYRGYSGTSCAIGCLIPDSFYDKDMEGIAVFTNKYRTEDSTLNALEKALAASGIGRRSYPLLERLQKVHDSQGAPRPNKPFNLVELKEDLVGVAKYFKIRQPDVLKELNV